LIGYLATALVLLAIFLFISVYVQQSGAIQNAKFLAVDLSHRLDQSATGTHLPSMAEWMTEGLMRAIEVEGVGELYEHFHPWKIPIGLVGFIAVARTLRWLIVAEDTWRFLATNLATNTGLGRVTPIGKRAHFPLGLYRICALHHVYG